MTVDEPFRILIVDDEPNIRSGLAKALKGDSFEIATAEDAEAARAAFRNDRHHLVITDLKMPGPLSGLDLVRQIKHERPETWLIVITAHGSIESAVEAMRQGANDYVVKPVDLGMLRLQVRNAFDQHCLQVENRRLRERLAAAGELPELIGQSAAMRELCALIRQVAGADVPVLIEGESGTGKELVARAIHQLGPRRGGPFVAANVGALPETLIESELFGYEKGAFSGASRFKPGLFEMAHEGTLFLDEAEEMHPKTQVDLLRVLEQGEVRRLGGRTVIPVDVRLLGAFQQSPERLVAAGRLREDLYYRLAVVPLRVPPLRERRDDIPLLAQHFLQRAEARHRLEPKSIAAGAMRLLCDHPWPGNVRQLRNCMERIAVTVAGPIIHAEDLPVEMRTAPPKGVQTLEAAVREAERAAILAALTECNNHRERTAQLLGISVRTLHYKLNLYGLQ